MQIDKFSPRETEFIFYLEKLLTGAPLWTHKKIWYMRQRQKRA